MLVPLLTSLLLLPLAAPPASPPPTAPLGSEGLLMEAREAMADLENDRAAALLTEVIVDEHATEAQLVEARARLAEVEVTRGFNSEARAHYRWLLDHDATFAVDDDAPPKIGGVFRLVREDWRKEREQEARLLEAREARAAVAPPAAPEPLGRWK